MDNCNLVCGDDYFSPGEEQFVAVYSPRPWVPRDGSSHVDGRGEYTAIAQLTLRDVQATSERFMVESAGLGGEPAAATDLLEDPSDHAKDTSHRAEDLAPRLDTLETAAKVARGELRQWLDRLEAPVERRSLLQLLE